MTRNPWDVKQGSSGSSAGSAAATAAGLVGFAVGSETSGSILSPCRVCRVTGPGRTDLKGVRVGYLEGQGAVADRKELDVLKGLGATLVPVKLPGGNRTGGM